MGYGKQGRGFEASLVHRQRSGAAIFFGPGDLEHDFGGLTAGKTLGSTGRLWRLFGKYSIAVFVHHRTVSVVQYTYILPRGGDAGV